MPAQAGYVSPAKIFARSTPGVIWVGSEQQAALDHLARNEPVRVVLGPASSGKSTLLRFFGQQARDAVVLTVSGPQSSAASVLTALLTAAELGPWILSEVEQRNLLSVFLQERQARGKRIVVCIDDVSGFGPDAWAEIERLRLLKVNEQPAVELAIVGADLDAIRVPLAGLVRSEDALNPHFLPSPTDEDVAEYIDWRLAQFGVHNVFSGEACALINSVTRGRFNFINVLCQVVLLEQARTHAEVIDTALVEKAVNAVASIKEDAHVALEPLVEKAPVQPRPGRLVVTCEGRVVRTAALHSRMLIGRSTDNDLHLPSRFVSNHHAAILQMEQGHYYIVDLNSANGVLVNGKSVTNSPLLDGDVLSLGQFRIDVALCEPEREHAADIDTDDTDVMPAPAYAPVLRAIKR